MQEFHGHSSYSSSFCSSQIRADRADLQISFAFKREKHGTEYDRTNTIVENEALLTFSLLLRCFRKIIDVSYGGINKRILSALFFGVHDQLTFDGLTFFKKQYSYRTKKRENGNDELPTSFQLM